MHCLADVLHDMELMKTWSVGQLISLAVLYVAWRYSIPTWQNTTFVQREITSMRQGLHRGEMLAALVLIAFVIATCPLLALTLIWAVSLNKLYRFHTHHCYTFRGRTEKEIKLSVDRPQGLLLCAVITAMKGMIWCYGAVLFSWVWNPPAQRHSAGTLGALRRRTLTREHFLLFLSGGWGGAGFLSPPVSGFH